ncbi:hypothetical protein K2173_015591 [Erythroxylum novogranatense]|uniref:Transcriptional corepressor LEUNIG n=1 Tax=Erythroxylum novogranatense TaxID=1862640 RepID=A0AAV8SE60_9ROSI|nr:hypothetical protein K2173_015591 [Erythroxylum novogranatense]
MSHTNWEADKMLDVYIYDYLIKRKLHASAKAFQAEGNVSTDPVAIDAPGGFLFEWWSVFWDIFIARTNEKHSEAAASYIESQLAKARELQQQQHHPHPKPQQHQQMQMPQLLLQRHAQQQQQQQQQQHQRRDGNQHLNGGSIGLATNDASRHTTATASAMATQIYEDRLKLPLQRNSSDDVAMKQRLSDNVGQLLDPNNASLLKTALGGQPPGHTLHGAPGCSSIQNRSQQLPVSTQEMKTEMAAIINSRNAGSEGSLMGIHGSTQGGDKLTLKGWPLTGLEQLGLLQHQRLMQSPQSLNKFQLQQQLMLQAQQNLPSPSVNDLERRKLKMLVNSQTMAVGKDGSFNSADALSNIGSPMHVGSPVMSRAETDVLAKLQQQHMQNSQQQQQYPQHPLSSQQSQSSNQHLAQQEKIIGSGGMTIDGSMSSTFQGNEQASKSQIGRKRKQPGSSSGPANSSGTGNTAGPSPSSPSTPSTHTPGDAMSMPLSHSGGSSKPLLMFGSDGLGSLGSAANELADIDRFVDDKILDENVESFFSHDAADPRDRVGQSGDVTKGITFSEIRHISASASKVECCDFSSDGKLLATGGHDKKVTLWCAESFTVKSTLEEHSQWITDVRFSTNMSRLATSSADKTVRVWESDNPGFSIRTFMGHSTTVTSVDFHPTKEDLICSCDNNSEMRYWNIKNGSCAGVFKSGATLMRFQPRFGRILAATSENLVTIFDVETSSSRIKLQGHKNPVHSVCWEPSGEYLASVSDDSVRLWKIGSGSKGDCVHELNCSGNKFNTCVFHPTYPFLLVVGCYETLELWSMAENKTMTLTAHEKLVSSLAASSVTGVVASASHDKCVKLWK